MGFSGGSAAAARRAWVIGGGLLLASVVVGVATQPLVGLLSTGNLVGTLLISAALIVFAVGIRGAGSVVARRPLGMVALCVLAVWTPFAQLAEQVLVAGLTTSGSLVPYGYGTVIVQFVLALVACVQIARAGVVPRPWSWSPTWVLAAVTASWLISQAAGLGVVDGQEVPGIAAAVMTLDGLVRVGAPVFLGALAIGLAGRGAVAGPAALRGSAWRRRASS